MRAPRRDRWYGSVRVLRDGRMRFSAVTFPGLNNVAIWDASPMKVAVFWAGLQVLMLWPDRGRVATACFNYLLKPDQLRDAVRNLRTVRGGLAGWIRPALQWTQNDLSAPNSANHPGRPLLKVIPELLDACRDLPVSEAWKRYCRQFQRAWVAHLREHPEEVDELPWFVRDGFPQDVLDSARASSGKSRRRRSGRTTSPRAR